jgi:hypothetical protein
MAAFACQSGTTPICDAGLECGPYTVLPPLDATVDGAEGDAAEDAEDAGDAAEMTGDSSDILADSGDAADAQTISDSGHDSSGDSGHDSSD